MAQMLETPSMPQWRNPKIMALLGVLALIVISGVYGYIISRDISLLMLLGIPVIAAAVILGARQPELLTVILLGITWGYISEILVKFHNVPSVAKSLVVVMVAIALYRRFTGERIHFASHPLLWWMIGYLLVVGGGLWYAASPNRAWLVFIDFAKEVLLFFVVINLLSTERWFERGIWTMLLVCGLIGTVTLYQEITHTYANQFGGLARSNMGQIAEGVANRARAGGPTSEPNAFGQQMLVLVPVGIWAALYARTMPSRIIGGFAAFACLSGAALSFSRGTYLALMVMFIVLVLHLRLNARYLMVLPLIVVALSMAPADLRARFGTLNTLLPGGERTTGERDASLARREIEMTMAAYMFVDHPIAGVGADNYATHYPDYVRSFGSDTDDEQRNAHSYYLEIAAEHGLLGLIAIGGIMILTFSSLRQARVWFKAVGNQRMAELMSALMIGFIGYAVSAIFLHGDYSRFLWLQVDLAAAASIVAWQAYRQTIAVNEEPNQAALVSQPA